MRSCLGVVVVGYLSVHSVVAAEVCPRALRQVLVPVHSGTRNNDQGGNEQGKRGSMMSAGRVCQMDQSQRRATLLGAKLKPLLKNGRRRKYFTRAKST
jgi:hypothetical protein